MTEERKTISVLNSAQIQQRRGGQAWFQIQHEYNGEEEDKLGYITPIYFLFPQNFQVSS